MIAFTIFWLTRNKTASIYKSVGKLENTIMHRLWEIKKNCFVVCGSLLGWRSSFHFFSFIFFLPVYGSIKWTSYTKRNFSEFCWYNFPIYWTTNEIPFISKINQKMVNTIWFWFNVIKSRYGFLKCVNLCILYLIDSCIDITIDNYVIYLTIILDDITNHSWFVMIYI